MKTFTKIVAAFALLGVLASAAVAAPATSTMAPKTGGKMIMHKKGGYVHATTVMTKSGKMVHRKGYYRHATTGKMSAMKSKMTPKMAPKTTAAPAAPKM